jgi:hypothetical protein
MTAGLALSESLLGSILLDDRGKLLAKVNTVE